MDPHPEDVDEDIPNEIVAELEARDRMQSNVVDEDESVFSDVVQNAFKKYQNEVYDENRSSREHDVSLCYISSVLTILDV